MIAETKREVKTLLRGLPSPRRYPDPKELLMVTPAHFRVEYAINAFMKTASGELQKVNVKKAAEQWRKLKWVYEDLGLTVHELEGQPRLPDMVFAANQSFPFRDRETGEPSVLMARMRSPKRQPEVAFFEDWYASKGYRVHHLENAGLAFEGNGDALLHPKLPLVWGGYGQRTDRDVYEEMSRRFGLQVIALELKREEFYHLDTCFSILSPKAVALVESAFSKESLAIVREVFDTVIALDESEALENFAGNCHCPNRRDVILQKGAKKTVKALEAAGFQPHEVDTSEFLKSGGSVFCLKMMLC